MKYKPYFYTAVENDQRINAVKKVLEQKITKNSLDLTTALSTLFESIDLTSLETRDNTVSILELCEKAVSFQFKDKTNIYPSAVCVYPPFIRLVKKSLQNMPIKTACVAGCFPSAQSPLIVKSAEVKYAIDEGADEVDMVLSVGKFLEGSENEVFDEIAVIRELCRQQTLKVILETGELKTNEHIFEASLLALDAGADFIKTSTGKVAINATPEAFLVMMDALLFYKDKTGNQRGIKAAGGITDINTALLYYQLFNTVLGNTFYPKEHFRIGASRLASKIFEKMQS